MKTITPEVLVERLSTSRTKGAATLLHLTKLPQEKKASHLLAFARSTEKGASVRQAARDAARKSIVDGHKKPV